MKCIVEKETSDSNRCSRCERKDIGCFFESHKRGRRPGSKVHSRCEVLQTPLGSNSLPQSRINTPSEGPQSAVEQLVNSNNVTEYISQESQNVACQIREPISQDTLDVNDSLAPAELLSTEATREFSLENVFIIRGAEKCQESQNENNVEDSTGDPIAANLVSLPVAKILFDSFLTYLNPFVVHLDPQLHTFELVQKRSSILLTVLLCSSARIFHESLYQDLRHHAEKLLAKAMTSCNKSIEIVQAILLLTYWKDPDDGRSWYFVGFAIRMCISMNWHRFTPLPSSGTELEIREQRNKERTWMILFIYDRSLSLQLGRPWMQHVDHFLRNTSTWHKQPYSVPKNDHLLVAFLQLRLIGAEKLNFWPSSFSSNLALNTQLQSHFTELEQWESTWCDDNQKAGGSIDKFMIQFYGAHFRLMLTSSRLQILHSGGEDTVGYIQSCLTLGDYIFRLLLDRLASSQQLYYVQDSIHVMTVYTTVLLIKLLVSMQAYIPSEIEQAMIETILEASEVFSPQTSNLHATCSALANFLKRIVCRYQNWRKDTAEALERISGQADGIHVQSLSTGNEDLLSEREDLETLSRVNSLRREQYQDFGELTIANNLEQEYIDAMNLDIFNPNTWAMLFQS